MGQIFDFGKMEEKERAIKETWADFRNALANGAFQIDDMDRALQYTFLRVYDDLFNKNQGIMFNTRYVGDLKTNGLGRGTILKEDEIPNYERFIPKKEFLKNDNRFSPSGVEWLYLVMGAEAEMHECSHNECRAKAGDRFGFCHFAIDSLYETKKIVDLTIADTTTYSELNNKLEQYGQRQVKAGIKRAKALGFIPRNNINEEEFKRLFTEWGVYTYSKLLSEQIFEPLNSTDDKRRMYAPFQTMAQYYISLGYVGIIYGSTVSNNGKNVVLFNKSMVKPYGKIEDYRIT